MKELTAEKTSPSDKAKIVDLHTQVDQDSTSTKVHVETIVFALDVYLNLAIWCLHSWTRKGKLFWKENSSNYIPKPLIIVDKQIETSNPSN